MNRATGILYVWAVCALTIFIADTFLATPAYAQGTTSSQALLEEVTVTARRRVESLQDLPLSIAALSADAMEAQGIYTIQDVGEFVPNVTLTQSDRANNTRVVIRGIGGGNPDPAFMFGSGIYLDGHFISSSLGGYMSTLDIERVELLRGPQGTLFGKNVTGGAVNIITAKPGPDFESNITVRAAEHGQQDIRGMVNFPINDNVFARLSAASETFDGYYFNRNLNVDTGATDLQSVNGAFRFLLGSAWTIDLSANIQKRRDDNAPRQCNPLDGSAPAWGSLGGTRPPHLDRFYYMGMTQDHHAACASDAAAGTFVNSSDKYSFSYIDTESVFANVQWDSDGAVGALDSVSFRANASYRRTEYDFLIDRDGMYFDIDSMGTTYHLQSSGDQIGVEQPTRSAEVILEAQANDRLEFTVGMNYLWEKQKQGDGRCRLRFEQSGFRDVIPGSNPPAPVNPGGSVNCDDARSGIMFDLAPSSFIPFIIQARGVNESLGVFSHLTYALNDRWDLDLGARWTEDDREVWNMESAIDGCTTDDPQLRSLGNAPATGDSQTMCEFSWTVDFQSTILDGFYNQAEGSWSEVTPMASLTRHLDPGDVLDSGIVYFLYSEGFLTGGFNNELNSNLPGIGDLLTFGPETVSNYEVGFKGTLLDGRMQLMADVFYMDYSNKQEGIGVANPDGEFGPSDTVRLITNVASVDISGIELELRASPWAGGFLSVDLGVLDNEYGEYRYPDPAGGSTPIDESNTVIQDLTADWTLNLAIEHEFNLANGGSLIPRLNIYAQDSYDYMASTTDAPPSLCNQDAYTKVGARLTYRPPADNWRVTLFGNNITDEKIFEFCNTTRGVYTYRHARPAYWGVEFSANWGNQ